MPQTDNPLTQLAFLKQVPRADLDALWSKAGVRHLPAKRMLFKEGQTATRTYVLVSGRMSASIPTEHGDQRVYDIGAGETVGEEALYVVDPKHLCNVKALTNCELMEISPALLSEIQGNQAAKLLELHTLEALSRRIRSTHRVIERGWQAQRAAASKAKAAAAQRPSSAPRRASVRGARPSKPAPKATLRTSLRKLFGGE